LIPLDCPRGIRGINKLDQSLGGVSEHLEDAVLIIPLNGVRGIRGMIRHPLLSWEEFSRA
jgi:hypothetical protein